MFQSSTTNTLDLFTNLGDKMAEMLSGEIRPGQDPTPAQQVIEEYGRVRLIYSEIKAQLEGFNRTLADAIASGDPNPLRTLLTGAGYQRMEDNFESWRSSGIVDLTLEKFDFLSLIQPERIEEPPVGQRARALTFETWTFHYGNGMEKLEDSLNLYTLVRAEEGWQVESVEFFTKG